MIPDQAGINFRHLEPGRCCVAALLGVSAAQFWFPETIGIPLIKSGGKQKLAGSRDGFEVEHSVLEFLEFDPHPGRPLDPNCLFGQTTNSHKKTMITVRRKGKEFGPYDTAQVVALVEARRLAGSDLARSDADQRWRPLANLPEILEFVPPSLPPMPTDRSWVVTLCILTIIGSILGALRGLFYEMFADFGGSSHSFWRGWAYAVLNLGTLVGAIAMLARRADGLYLYTASQILYLLVVVSAIVDWGGDGREIFAILIGASFFLPSAVFLALYWLPVARKSLQ